MPTLELTIQRQRDGAWPVVAELAASDGGLPSGAEGRLSLEPAALDAEAQDPRAYGERLGAALFVGPVRDALAAALAGAPDEQTRLLLAGGAPDSRNAPGELVSPVTHGHSSAKGEAPPLAVLRPAGAVPA